MAETKTIGQERWEAMHLKQLCVKADCTMAAQCMRQVHLGDSKNEYLMIVNPQMATGDEECKYYYPDSTTRYGKGFISMLKNLPRVVEERFRYAMLLKYPRNKYFKLRKGEVLCGSKDQTIIMNILRDLNIETTDPFDGWVEKKDWG